MDPELIEYLDRRFAEVAERFDRVDQRFEQVDQRFEQVDQRLEQFDQRLEQVDQRLEQFDQRLEQVEQRLEPIDQRFREVHVLIEWLNSKIQTVAEGVHANGEAHRTLRRELDRQFEEVKAVNRLSYVELDRRLRRLEMLESG